MENYGITKLGDGRIRTNGGEVRIPANLLWFPVPVDVLHLPGSEDGDPEFWSEEDFIRYCEEMAE